MANYRHIVRLPYDTGLPQDVAVNVWHSISDDDAEAIAFAALLVTFYQAIDNRLSVLLSSAANAATVTTYDLGDAEPRVPVHTTSFTLTTSASSNPSEVAICLSFQGIRLPGLPQARRRGRIFLGPLGGVHDSTTGRPLPAVITEIVTAADNLLAAANGTGVGLWAVFSPTNAQTVPVQNGWVDDEYDTVRGRGLGPSTRSTFS